MAIHKNTKYKNFEKTLANYVLTWYITQAWFVGQAVKTSPSHGENTGSIPVRTVLLQFTYIPFKNTSL